MGPIHVAVENARLDVLEMLLARPGIDVNAQTSVGFSPLHVAVHSQNPRAVEMLFIRPEIDANSRDIVSFRVRLEFFFVTFDATAHSRIARKHGLS
jgi:ankyrin repeat protein